MPLELRQVTSAKEVPEIIEGWIKNEVHLHQPLLAVDSGKDESSHKDRVDDLSRRQWYRHSTTPGSAWRKVVDTALDDKVVTSSRWSIHTEPASCIAEQPARAYRLPPGPERRFCEAIFANFSAVHDDLTRKSPHVRKSSLTVDGVATELDILDLVTNYTMEEHRRRGANTLMIEWGTKKADELGLETWLEATALGSMIYARACFRLLAHG